MPLDFHRVHVDRRRQEAVPSPEPCRARLVIDQLDVERRPLPTGCARYLKAYSTGCPWSDAMSAGSSAGSTGVAFFRSADGVISTLVAAATAMNPLSRRTSRSARSGALTSETPSAPVPPVV